MQAAPSAFPALKSLLRTPLAVAALAVAAALPLPAPAAAQDATVPVSGRLVDAASGQPVEGGFMGFMDLDRNVRAESDGQGRFRVADVPVGEHRVLTWRLGYRDQVHVVRVERGGPELVLRMSQDPVVLEAIQGVVDRLEERRGQSTLGSSAWDREDLARIPRTLALDFVTDYAGVRTSSCSQASVQRGCSWVRGEPQEVVVVIDDQHALGGMDDLVGIPLRDLYRVEVFGGGSLVMVYSKHYVERMLQRRVALRPISAYLGAMGPRPIGARQASRP